MTITPVDYWYDEQIKRLLMQVVRGFSGFSYQPGIKNGVASSPIMVPARMAMIDRMTAHIIANNSENTLLVVPIIAVALTGMKGRRADVQNLTHIDTLQVNERGIVNGAYTSGQGKSYKVQRLMPRPFELAIDVSIVTSTQEQKFQLMEQILPIIFPSFQIQSSDNPLDWSALTDAVFEDMTWTSRTLPIGTEVSSIDICTINLKVPMWLNPPAKVNQQKIIQQIITNINSGTLSDDGTNEVIQGELLSQTITTPGDYHIMVQSGVITLLNDHGGEFMADGSLPSWTDVIALYGVLRPTISTLRVTIDGNIEERAGFVAGTIQIDTNNVNKLLWQIDANTLPGNTLSPVNAILDPTSSYPGHGIPAAANGQRYLLVNDLGASVAWGSFTARANDVIAYVNGAWTVAFTSNSVTSTQYMLNLHTGNQLQWTGKEWILSIDNVYQPGYWHFSL